MTKPNYSFMAEDPNYDIPERPILSLSLPMSAAQQRAVYSDVMSTDIGSIHARVREYILSVTDENDYEPAPPSEMS